MSEIVVTPEIVVWTKEELEIIFPNEIQRELFLKGFAIVMNRILSKHYLTAIHPSH
jgi:hypothetical protein